MIPQHVEHHRIEVCGNILPATQVEIDDRERHQHGHGNHCAVNHIHRNNREHAGKGGKGNDERGRKQNPLPLRDVRHQVEHESAAPKLIPHNRRVRDHNDQRAEYPRGFVVPKLQNIRHRKLCNPPHPSGQEKHQHNPNPGASRHPQLRNPDPSSQTRPRQQRSRSQPGTQKRPHQFVRRNRPPGHHKILLIPDRTAFPNRDAHQQGQIQKNNNKIDRHRGVGWFLFNDDEFPEN